ncbi:transglutaminase family protein [Methylobacterium sp. E-065]|uniref:transglutaminase family protein n=1 Tax=Methylobacterium sp. E-065 TaxID=2836583 RepID=UPI001FB9A843|nr:transglutaminase family protein [Methylobacterium sp. E-065]MCJ2022431.1 transglutaminase family protein [Methylobacterium sp. E-065]
MIYTLRHRTTYRYGRPVRFARCTLRLKPQDGEGQSVLASAVTIDPSPATAVTRHDYFGIDALAITLETPHTVFSVEALSTVRVERAAPPPPESGMAWERVRDAVVAGRDLGGRAPVHFLYPSGRVPLLPEVTAYARPSFSAGRCAYGAAHDLMLRIGRDFRFDARATNVYTPLAESFALRAGVCQDFAHVMIAGLRGMGLPAAYVSGYLRTVPPPGRPRLRGADASHAWVAVWCGAGWLGLDPTNGVPIRDDHIVVARGRDYGDVAPLDGIVSGSGKQRLKVEVDVIPDTETQDLALVG